MGIEFLQRVRKTSILTSVFLFVFVAAYAGIGAGAAWLSGCAWSLVNLFVIGLLVDTLCAEGKARRMRMVMIALLKVPVLYAVGFLLLKAEYLPLFPLLAGFLWPLLVIMLKMLGRAILKMDDTSRLFGGATPRVIGSRPDNRSKTA